MTTPLLHPSPTATGSLPYQLLVQALDACRSPLVLCDVRLPGAPVVYANPAYCALTGFSAGEVIGCDFDFLQDPDAEPLARAQMHRAIAAGESLTAVLRSRRRDGSAFWNRLGLSPIRDARGELTHYVGMPEDVSERISKDFNLQLLLDAQGAAADSLAAEKAMDRSQEPLQFVAAGLNRGRASARLLEFELHNALAKNQFRLAFQPQVHLSSGNVVGFEALLRWQHPLRGAIAPAEFIPAVEACGMSRVVTHWVLEQGVAQLRAWEDLGHHGLQMAINALPSVFEGTETESFLLELLRRHEIAGNQIELELTERNLIDASAEVIDRLQGLRRHGVSVAIDDFGTAYSNLSCLARLPLDCLKIDLSFVQGATSNPSDAMVSRMTCELARALKLRVVVEGIETAGQLQFFSDLRCEVAQGYLFARPLEAVDATALLQSGRVFQQSARAGSPARHLLLLDDEPNILRALRRVFRAANYTVHTANTPDEAFELLARHPVGVVMSDQRMPLMRGTDFLARVKQLYPDTVRIVLSGYTELQSVTEAINEGAIYKFLTKPWNDVQLAEEIEQAFRQYEMVAESQRLQQRLRDSNRELESRLKLNQQLLLKEGVALDVSHEALGVVPVPILGIDASGMIAISNAAADQLLGGGVSVVGEHVSDVLPADADAVLEGDTCNGLRVVRIGDLLYEVKCNDLGATSRGTGTVITLLQGARA